MRDYRRSSCSCLCVDWRGTGCALLVPGYRGGNAAELGMDAAVFGLDNPALAIYQYRMLAYSQYRTRSTLARLAICDRAAAAGHTG